MSKKTKKAIPRFRSESVEVELSGLNRRSGGGWMQRFAYELARSDGRWFVTSADETYAAHFRSVPSAD